MSSTAKRMEDIVKNLQKSPTNKECFDCKRAGLQPAVVLPYAIFVCTSCSGLHRQFNGHMVHTITMTSWTANQVSLLKNGGNAKAKSTWLHRFPDNPRDRDDIVSFIRNCFERRMWLDNGSEVDTPAQVIPTPAATRPSSNIGYHHQPVALDAPRTNRTTPRANTPQTHSHHTSNSRSVVSPAHTSPVIRRIHTPSNSVVSSTHVEPKVEISKGSSYSDLTFPGHVALSVLDSNNQDVCKEVSQAMAMAIMKHNLSAFDFHQIVMTAAHTTATAWAAREPKTTAQHQQAEVNVFDAVEEVTAGVDDFSFDTPATNNDVDIFADNTNNDNDFGANFDNSADFGGDVFAGQSAPAAAAPVNDVFGGDIFGSAPTNNNANVFDVDFTNTNTTAAAPANVFDNPFETNFNSTNTNTNTHTNTNANVDAFSANFSLDGGAAVEDENDIFGDLVSSSNTAPVTLDHPTTAHPTTTPTGTPSFGAANPNYNMGGMGMYGQPQNQQGMMPQQQMGQMGGYNTGHMNMNQQHMNQGMGNQQMGMMGNQYSNMQPQQQMYGQQPMMNNQYQHQQQYMQQPQYNQQQQYMQQSQMGMNQMGGMNMNMPDPMLQQQRMQTEQQKKVDDAFSGLDFGF